MEEDKYETWDTDELFQWFVTSVDVLPDEDKLNDEGIDGSNLTLLEDEEYLEKVGIDSPTSKSKAMQAIQLLLSRNAGEERREPSDYEEEAIQEEQEEVKEDDGEVAPKLEMWLEHICNNIEAFEKDIDAAENKIKVFLFRLYKNDPKFDENDFKVKCLRELEEQLEKEGRFGNSVRKLFEEVKSYHMNNQGEKTFEVGLQKILFEIEPFNISLFRHLAKQTEKQLERVRNKKILLLLGPTGSGKSTTIQYLCGSKLVKKKIKIKDGVRLQHIDVDKNGGLPQDCDPELEKVSLSPFSVSETTFIRVIRTKYEDGFEWLECFLCDSPGLEDTRGEELNVANIFGLVQAAKFCKAVIPIIVMSQDSMGDRMTNLKKISRNLAGLINNPQKHMGKMNFVFTKYDDTKEEREKIYSVLFEAYHSLKKNEKDKQDKNLIAFFNIMAKNVKPSDQITIVDPFNRDVQDTILQKLAKCAEIDDPLDAFKMCIGDSALNLIKTQINQDKKMLHNYALHSKKYDLIHVKLTNIKFLVECLEGQIFVQDCYNELLQVIRDHQNQLYDRCQQSLTQASKSLAVLSPEVLDQCKDHKDDFSELYNILVQFEAPQEGLNPKSFDNLVKNLVQSYDSELGKLVETQKEQFLKDPNTERIMQSLHVIKTYFSEDQKIDSIFSKQIDGIRISMNDLTVLAQDNASKGNFSQVVQTLDLIEEANQNLNIIKDDEKNQLRQQLREKLIEMFESLSEHVTNAIRNLQPGPQEQLIDIISSFQDQWKLLKSASENENFLICVQDFEIDEFIKDLVYEIQSQLDKVYQDSYDQVSSQCKNEVEKCDLSVLCSMEHRFNLIVAMSKDLTIDKSIQSNPQQLVNDIQSSYQQQHMTHINNLSLYLQQDKSLEVFCVQIEGLTWIDRIFNNNIFEAKLLEVKTKMANYVEHMERVANIAFGKNNFTELIEVLLKVKNLGSNFTQRFKDLVSEYKNRIIQDWIDPIEQYQNPEQIQLDLVKCQKYVAFFQNFDDQGNILGLSNTFDQKRDSFYQYLKTTAKKYFCVSTIDSHDQAKDIESKLEMLNDQIKNETPLSIILDAIQQQKTMIIQVCRQCSQISLDVMNVTSSGDREELNLLRNKIDVILLLNKYIVAEWPQNEQRVDLFKLRQEVITSLTEGSHQDEEDLYKSLATRDFIAVKQFFLKMVQPNQSRTVLTRVFRELKRSLNQLRESLESFQRRLNLNSGHQEFIKISEDINHIQKSDHNLTGSILQELQEVYLLKSQNQEPSQSQDQQQQLIQDLHLQLQDLQVALNDCSERAQKQVNEVFKILLDRVSLLIQNKKFKEALTLKDKLDLIKATMDYILKPEIIKQIADVYQKINDGIEDATNAFLHENDFECFLYDSFDEYIESLQVIRGEFDGGQNLRSEAIKKVNKKFIRKIQELREKGPYLSGGLDNQELNLIKRALCYLSEPQQKHIKYEIDALEQNYNHLRLNRITEIDDLTKMQNHDLEKVRNLAIESKKNNDSAVLKKIQENIKYQFEPCFKKLMNQIETNDLDNLKSLWMLFESYSKNLSDQFLFIQQSSHETDVAVQQKLNQVKKKLSQFQSENSILLQQPKPQNQKNRFQALIEDVIFIKNLKVLNIMQQKGDETLEEIQRFSLFCQKQISIETQLVEQCTQQLEEGKNSKISQSLIKQINRQIKLQNNIDQLSRIFIDNDDAFIIPEGDQILQAESFEMDIVDAINKMLETFMNPFADPDLSVDGHILSLYKSMQKSYINLNLLVQLELQSQISFNGASYPLNKIVNAIQDFLINQILDQNNKIQKEFQELDKELPGLELIGKIQHFTNHLKQFLVAFEQIEFQKELQQLNHNLSHRFMKIIDDWKTKCLDTEKNNINLFVKQLIALKQVSDYSLPFKAQIDRIIDEILENSKEKFQINALSQCIEDSPDPSSKSLLEEHAMFKANLIALINSRIQNPEFGINYVSNEIQGNEFKIISGAAQIINKLSPFESWKIEEKKSDIDRDFLRSQYQKFVDEYGEFDSDKNCFTGLLGRFLRPKPKINVVKQELNDLAKEIIINKNLQIRPIDLEKIPKVLAYIFCIWTLESCQGHFEQQDSNPDSSKKNFLRAPHAAQVVSIMRVLGMGNFKSTPILTNHLVEVLTGQGKSLILAVTSATLALLGANCYCACYSEYLSKRDYEDFKSLFQHLDILDKVHYGTMEQLCETVINERGSIRQVTKQMITTGKPVPVQKSDQNTIKVLLIDEVDVFFSQNFYGNVYQPSLLIKDECIQNLIKFIWDNKQNDLKYPQIVQSEQYQICQKEVPNFIELLNEGIKDLLFSLKEVENHNDYIIENDKIGYLNGDQYAFNAQMGYLTQFAYLREYDQSKVTENALEMNLGLRINCGAYSFAKIPETFNLILGVTGTLKNITQTQRDIITKIYKILQETHMPSVFGKSNLQYNHKDNFIIVSKKEHFSRIRKEIDTQLQGKNGVKNSRAVLVVFENERVIKEFQHSVHCQEIKSRIQIITEQSGIQQAEQLVKLSSRQGNITFMTRNFGRGTDFSCKDDRVNNQGGVAIIQTFLSESESEDAQIRGRVARQGQDGSYSIVINIDDLIKVDIQEQDVETYQKEGNLRALFKKIMDTLNNNLNESQKQNNENVRLANEEHDLSSDFLKSLYDGEVKHVLQKLRKFNLSRAVGGSCKTLILIDATISMGKLLDKTKTAVQKMLKMIKKVLEQNNVDPSLVLMKLAVYRNYDQRKEMIFQESTWETDAKNLTKFLREINCVGGWGKEALEVGLLKAVGEIPNGLQQIIVIGDAPPNLEKDIAFKQQDEYGKEYWDQQMPNIKPAQFYVDELKNNSIPIHTMYLVDQAKESFMQISENTHGKSYYLDVHQNDAADKLIEVVNVQILEKMDPQLLESYKANYGISFT